MSGKFINTKRKDTIDSLIDGFKERIKNPYYLHIDQKPTLTTFYNPNIEASTLDEGLKIVYSSTGEDSPLKYDKINNMFIYGLEKIIISLDNGEFGLEGDSIEGEGIILPNTFIPFPQAYFMIHYLNKNYLFKVINVSQDTLESGANFYRIAYKYEDEEDEKIQEQVVREYNMIVDNIGTQFKAIIRTNDYNFINEIQDISNQLKLYYKHLFYNDRVQTFIYNQEGGNIYDPYMIEFIKRNGILIGDGEFIYIDQQIYLEPMFGVMYNKSFLRKLELCEKSNLSNNNKIEPKLIEQPLSLLYMRKESYFEAKYTNEILISGYDIFDPEFFDNIDNSILISEMYDIITKYFNNIEITGDDILVISNMEYIESKTLFYIIPMIIFILEKQIIKLLRRN